ncbi:hypothetical protein VP01_1940g3 [Puccinia sorghi]|uniref:Uncharacterized protein n=1 Tax=Puccinia sorghi TaxID=27349 RepID=A0A0L6VCV0_9BASI|nr:hypothetical protein VP01_1940g3 [Puccinia sorghi]
MNTCHIYLFLSLALSPAAFSLLTGFDPKNLPMKSDPDAGQTGYNRCGTTAKPNSLCQTLFINSAEDFCVFGPPKPLAVGEAERIAVAYCSKDGHGTRLIPPNTFTSMHYVRTPHYVQITALGDVNQCPCSFIDLYSPKLTSHQTTKGEKWVSLSFWVSIPSSKSKSCVSRILICVSTYSADGHGNPIGGLVFGERGQFDRWTEFLAYDELSIRACFNTDQAYRYCEHIYDVEGSRWNMPGNYDTPGFDQCEGDDVPLPMGEYRRPDGSIYKWQRGSSPQPPPGTPGKLKTCKAYVVSKFFVRAPGATYSRSGRRSASPTTNIGS